jgi:hypothetical protein
MSSATRHVTTRAKARQRRRRTAQECLERDRHQVKGDRRAPRPQLTY